MAKPHEEASPGRTSDALRLARAILQNDKGDFAQHAQPVNPAAKRNILMNESSKGLNEDALVPGTIHRKNLHGWRISAGATNAGGAIQLPAGAGA
jgi:hypothetical protein